MKTIVIGTDGSDYASAALTTALELAGETGASVLCVGVDDSFDKAGIDPAPTAAAESAAGRAREHGIQAEFVTRIGPAAEQLLAAADACDADLIVVGSRCRGRLTSGMLGSIAHGLIRHSTRPVLVVTAPADAAAASVEATSSTAAADGWAECSVRAMSGPDAISVEPTGAVDALAAASSEADLIVVGSRGLHGFRSLGSVSERIAHAAACSTLVNR